MNKYKILLLLALLTVIAFTIKLARNNDHGSAGDTHVHTAADADHDHTGEDHDHTGEDHDHTDADHDHTGEDHDHTNADHDHTGEDHDHTDADHDHTGEDHDHTDADHDHTSEDHDHTAADHDHTAADHDHTAADHDHTAADHDHTGEDQEHAAADHGHTDEDHAAEGFIAVDSRWEKLVGLTTAKAVRRNILEIVTVPGSVIPDADRIAVINPLIDAGVNSVMAKIGDRVSTGDELVCLTSPEVGTLRAEYDKAVAEDEIAGVNLERTRQLHEEKIISERAWQEALRDRQLALVNLTYARKKLLAVGLSEAQLETPPSGHGNVSGSTIHLHSPLDGIVTARSVNLGEKVNAGSRLFEIIDLSRVWCRADVYEKDLHRISIGGRVQIRVAAYPGKVFSGRIFHVGSTISARTRTVDVLIDIANPDEKLKPGMFADTGIIVGEKKNALVIPVSAVMEDENLQIVFVKEGEGYHRHVITPGIRSGDEIEVVAGITSGAVVVTGGSYQLRSRARMQDVDPHAGHVH